MYFKRVFLYLFLPWSLSNWNRLEVTQRNNHHYMLFTLSCTMDIVVKWDKMERKLQFPPTLYKVLEKVKSYCKDAEYRWIDTVQCARRQLLLWMCFCWQKILMIMMSHWQNYGKQMVGNTPISQINSTRRRYPKSKSTTQCL